MNKFALLCIFFLTFPSLGQQPSPDPPASDRQVMELFELMHIREQTLAVLESSKEQVKASNRSILESRVPNIKPAQLAELDAIVDDLYRHYPVDRVLEGMIPVYQKHLSKSDLQAVSEFYSSPVGQKLLREMPAMTAEAMQASAASMQKDTEEIMQKLEEHMKDLARPGKADKTAQQPTTPRK